MTAATTHDDDGRPYLFDFYCGAGGAAMGYHRAGFSVIGVDQARMPRFPFPFLQADALAGLAQLADGAAIPHPGDPHRLIRPAAVHASPPCQAYSRAAAPRRSAGVVYPDLVQPTRELLERIGVPWIMENVPGAPMRPDFKLCGCMFALPLLQRERWFETSWHGFALRPPCVHTEPALSVTGHGIGAGNGQRDRLTTHLGRLPNTADARAAMGIDWMSRDELSQAIPPAYTAYLGALLHAQLLVHPSPPPRRPTPMGEHHA